MNQFIAKVLAPSFLFAFYVTFLITFVVAYATPSKAVLITLNTYNEADLEFWLMVLPSISIVLYYLHNQTLRGQNQ